MRLIPVKDHPTLMRDANTGAIVSNSFPMNYQNKKRQSERLNNLETDVQEIKQMLKQLLSVVNNG